MDQEKKSEEIKNLIKQVTEFDFVNAYYNKDKKSELAVIFKKLLNYDDLLIRKFMEQVLDSFKTLADDHGLIPTATEEVGTEEDKENEVKDELESTEETPEEVPEENPEETSEETPEEVPEENPEETPEPEAEAKTESVKTRGSVMTEQALYFLE